MTATIRIVIADDQSLVRGALAVMLGLEPDLEVVAEAGDGAEALAAVAAHAPDVALLDVQMPGMDGIDVAATVRTRHPATRVLMVTTFGRPGYLRRALQAGASGFVVKDTPARQLADAIRRVHQGLRVVDPQLAADSMALGDSPLTERETEVLRIAAEGGTASDIARRLHLSDGTVRNHLSNAMSKTGGRTRAEAATIAAERGWF
ncbi:response regulator transcription factor [Micrococcales bacterium 31B]|nr:response regulator transcription factor [Micrococcales bacterium 31B]